MGFYLDISLKNMIFLLLCLNACYDQPAFALKIYGHRGARGLAPENTIPGYQTALSIGVDYVDLDVNMTKDGVLVVTHDFTLNSDLTRDAEGRWIKEKIPIKDLTWNELQNYDVGRIKDSIPYFKYFPHQKAVDHTKIPSLKQVINYVKQMGGDDVGFQIEIKTDPTQPELTFTPEKLAQALATVLEEEGIVNRTEVQAFDFRCLLAIQKINPHIITAYLTDKDTSKEMRSLNPKIAGLWSSGYLLKDYDYSIPKMIKALGGKLWDPQDIELTKKDLDDAHQLGLKVVAWPWTEKSGTDFDSALNEKLIQMGIDGIITDRPDLLKQLIASQSVMLTLLPLYKYYISE